MSSQDTERALPYMATGVIAYYLIPPYWIIDKPADSEVKNAPADQLTREVYRGKLGIGVRVRATRDGLFVFDCGNNSRFGRTLFPNDEVHDPEKEALALERLLQRVRLINVHQACLYSARKTLEHTQAQIGKLYTLDTAFSPYHFEPSLKPNDFRTPVSLYIRWMREFSKEARSIRGSQHFYSQAVIEESLTMLNNIIQKSTLKEDLLLIVDLLFRAVSRTKEHNSEEAIVLIWTVCEKILNILWERYVEENRLDAEGEQRINKEKKKNLLGANYTTSIVSDILALVDKLPTSLYKELEKIRKLRNAWIHNLRPVDNSDADAALRTSLKLLNITFSLNLHIGAILISGVGRAQLAHYLKFSSAEPFFEKCDE